MPKLVDTLRSFGAGVERAVEESEIDKVDSLPTRLPYDFAAKAIYQKNVPDLSVGRVLQFDESEWQDIDEENEPKLWSYTKFAIRDLRDFLFRNAISECALFLRDEFHKIHKPGKFYDYATMALNHYSDYDSIERTFSGIRNGIPITSLAFASGGFEGDRDLRPSIVFVSWLRNKNDSITIDTEEPVIHISLCFDILKNLLCDINNISSLKRKETLLTALKEHGLSPDVVRCEGIELTKLLSRANLALNDTMDMGQFKLKLAWNLSCLVYHAMMWCRANNQSELDKYTVAVVPNITHREVSCALLYTFAGSLETIDNLVMASSALGSAVDPIQNKAQVIYQRFELGKKEGIESVVSAYSHEVANSTAFLFGEFMRPLASPFVIESANDIIESSWKIPLGRICLSPEAAKCVNGHELGFFPSIKVLEGCKAQMLIWSGSRHCIHGLGLYESEEFKEFSAVLDRLIILAKKSRAFHAIRGTSFKTLSSVAGVINDFEVAFDNLPDVTIESSPKKLYWPSATFKSQENLQVAFIRAVLAVVGNAIKHAEEEVTVVVTLVPDTIGELMGGILRFRCQNDFYSTETGSGSTLAVLELCYREFRDSLARTTHFGEPDFAEYIPTEGRRLWITEFEVPLSDKVPWLAIKQNSEETEKWQEL